MRCDARASCAGAAQHGAGLLGILGQGEDRALVERGLGQRRLVAGRLEDPHRALGAVLGGVGLPGHEPVARHAHQAQPQGDRVAEAGVELAPRRCRRAPPRGSGRRCRAPSRSRRARRPARPAPAAPRRARPPRGGRAPGGGRRRRAASRAACGPTARTVSTSPAATAWCIRRARSGRSCVRSAATTAWLSSRTRVTGRLLSIARRASSWRNRVRRGGPRSRPRARPRAARASSRRAGPRPARAATCEGTTDRRSSASRQSASSPRSRARTASLTLAGTSSGGAASVSVTKNGLPRVSAWTAAGVAAGAGRQRLHRVARQRRELDPVHRAAGERAEQAVQRMARIELVAGRQDEDRADGLDPARRVAEHVERGVVGPVDVLDDEDGRALLGQLLQQRGEDAIDRALVGQRGRQRAAAPGRRVVQRPQRARRDEVVARRHEDPRLGAQALDQRAHEARLADARLAGDQRRRAAALRALAPPRRRGPRAVRRARAGPRACPHGDGRRTR